MAGWRAGGISSGCLARQHMAGQHIPCRRVGRGQRWWSPAGQPANHSSLNSKQTTIHQPHSCQPTCVAPPWGAASGHSLDLSSAQALNSFRSSLKSSETSLSSWNTKLCSMQRGGAMDAYVSVAAAARGFETDCSTSIGGRGQQAQGDRLAGRQIQKGGRSLPCSARAACGASCAGSPAPRLLQRDPPHCTAA